jgi:competence protein ComEA
VTVESEEEEGPEAPRTVPPAAAVINVNQASYEDLRNLNLSVTQTGRLLAHRERLGGFRSLDDLDEIPGFPRSFLDDLKEKFTL